MSADFSPFLGHPLSISNLPAFPATKITLYFQQLTNCSFPNSFLFTFICVAPWCAFTALNPELSTVNCGITPLFAALPYVFLLTPFAVAFTHFNPGGRVSLPILKLTWTHRVEPDRVGGLPKAYNWRLPAWRYRWV